MFCTTSVLEKYLDSRNLLDRGKAVLLETLFQTRSRANTDLNILGKSTSDLGFDAFESCWFQKREIARLAERMTTLFIDVVKCVTFVP